MNHPVPEFLNPRTHNNEVGNKNVCFRNIDPLMILDTNPCLIFPKMQLYCKQGAGIVIFIVFVAGITKVEICSLK